LLCVTKRCRKLYGHNVVEERGGEGVRVCQLYVARTRSVCAHLQLVHSYGGKYGTASIFSLCNARAGSCEQVTICHFIVGS